MGRQLLFDYASSRNFSLERSDRTQRALTRLRASFAPARQSSSSCQHYLTRDAMSIQLGAELAMTKLLRRSNDGGATAGT